MTHPERPLWSHLARRIALRLVITVFVAIVLVASLVLLALRSYVPGF